MMVFELKPSELFSFLVIFGKQTFRKSLHWVESSNTSLFTPFLLQKNPDIKLKTKGSVYSKKLFFTSLMVEIEAFFNKTQPSLTVRPRWNLLFAIASHFVCHL